jgi:hypothetical protein
MATAAVDGEATAAAVLDGAVAAADAVRSIEAFEALPAAAKRVVLHAKLKRLYASVGIQATDARLTGLCDKYGDAVADLTLQLFKKYSRALFPLGDLAWRAHREVVASQLWGREFGLEFGELFAYASDDRNHGAGKTQHASNRTTATAAEMAAAEAAAGAAAEREREKKKQKKKSKAAGVFGALFQGVAKFAIAGFQLATNETASRRQKFHRVMDQLIGNAGGKSSADGDAEPMPEIARLATPVPQVGLLSFPIHLSPSSSKSPVAPFPVAVRFVPRNSDSNDNGKHNNNDNSNCYHHK